MQENFPGVDFLGLGPNSLKFRKRKKNQKVQIRHFHVVVVQRRQRNVEASVMREKVVSFLMNYYNCFFDVCKLIMFSIGPRMEQLCVNFA